MHRSFWPRRALAALALTALGTAFAVPLGAGVAGAAALSFTTTSLPTATVGVAYNQTIVATGGTVPYTYTLASGSVCPGLTFTGGGIATVTGTPTAAGDYSFTVQVTDSAGPPPAIVQESFIIDCQAAATLHITTTSPLPAATQGVGYSTTVAAAGGTKPYIWSASGLPTGLTIGTLTGTITGVPTVPGNVCGTVTVIDSSVPSQSASTNLCIDVTSGLVITTTSLPTATVGTAYSTNLAAAGGTTPYTWSLVSGALPPGAPAVTLSAGGVLSGTPSAPGTYNFVVKVTDSTAPTAETTTGNLTLVVVPLALTLVGAPPDGVVGVGYSFTFAAHNGTAPYSYGVTNGALPPGIFLNPATGQIAGTPTKAGFYPVTITACDSSVPQKCTSLSTHVTIQVPLAISTTLLPDGSVGTPYNSTVFTSGGLAPLHWVISGGALPGGLTLNPLTGQITGTPTTAGPFSFSVTVVDSSAPPQLATEAYNVVIDAGLALNTVFPDGVVGSGYSHVATVTGGIAPYSWGVSVGVLPPGLILTPSTGQISGTPTTPGFYPFTLTASDSSTPQLVAVAATSITIESVLTSLTTALPDGQFDVGYSQVVTAGNGLPPYHFAISAGVLPTGLGLSATTGLIAGTPTAIGQFQFIVTISDSSVPAQHLNIPLTITITNPLTFVCGVLPGGTIGSPYVGGGFTLAPLTTGGTTPYTWVQTGGTLPPGLTLVNSTGAITGTPIVAGDYSFTIGVVDSSSPIETATATCSILVTQLLTITTSSPLPIAAATVPYSTTLNAIGGTTPYTWTVSTGALPPGLTLTGAGVLHGTPAAPGTYNFTAKVTDSSVPTPQVAIGAFTVVVVPAALTNSTAAVLPNGTVGTFYTVGQTVTGGTKPYAYGINTGALPPGLIINPSTGVISGTPTTAGNYCFTVSVSDASTPVNTTFDSECINITSGLTISTTFLPTAAAGTGYSATVSAVGGVGPYTFSLIGGSLPPGLALTATGPAAGAITGTPTVPGTYFIVVQAKDSSTPTAETASQVLVITVT